MYESAGWLLKKLIFLFTLIFSLPAVAETWKVAAIADWPPYMDKRLGKQSIGYAALQETLKSIGVKLEVHFYPWARARSIALNDDSFVGYFCAWPEEIDEGFFPSSPVFYSPTVLVSSMENEELTEGWRDLNDKRIGLVRGYTYPDEYQNLKRQIRVANGETLLKFITLGRVDYGVIDLYVYHYLAENNPVIKALSKTLRIHKDSVRKRPLLLAFREVEENVERAARLRAALLRAP